MEDNLSSTSLGEDLPLQSMIERKVVGARGQHPRLEDTVQLLTSFVQKFIMLWGQGFLVPLIHMRLFSFSRGMLFKANSKPPRWVLDCLCDDISRCMRHIRVVLSDSVTIFLCVPCH